MPSTSTYIEDLTPVDLVLSLLFSLVVTLTALPLGILAAVLHVLTTLIRNIPTCVALGITCVVLTSAVLLASAGYVVLQSGLLGLRLVVGCKRAIESSAAVGTNMASVFLDEWTREKKWASSG